MREPSWVPQWGTPRLNGKRCHPVWTHFCFHPWINGYNTNRKERHDSFDYVLRNDLIMKTMWGHVTDIYNIKGNAKNLHKVPGNTYELKIKDNKVLLLVGRPSGPFLLLLVHWIWSLGEWNEIIVRTQKHKESRSFCWLIAQTSSNEWEIFESAFLIGTQNHFSVISTLHYMWIYNKTPKKAKFFFISIHFWMTITITMLNIAKWHAILSIRLIMLLRGHKKKVTYFLLIN